MGKTKRDGVWSHESGDAPDRCRFEGLKCKVALGALLAVGALTVPSVPSIGSPRHSLVPPTLPSSHAPSAIDARSSNWIVTAKPGRATRRIAHRYHAKPIGSAETAVYRVRGRYVRRMIRALKRADTYVYDERDSSASSTQAIPPDPLDPTANWRSMVVDPNLSPPPVTPSSPLLAIVDDPVDLTHPEFGGSAVKTLGQVAPRSSARSRNRGYRRCAKEQCGNHRRLARHARAERTSAESPVHLLGQDRGHFCGDSGAARGDQSGVRRPPALLWRVRDGPARDRPRHRGRRRRGKYVCPRQQPGIPGNAAARAHGGGDWGGPEQSPVLDRERGC